MVRDVVVVEVAVDDDVISIRVGPARGSDDGTSMCRDMYRRCGGGG